MTSTYAYRTGGRQRRRLKKTYLIPHKHPSPILVLHQFPYFPIGEVHSKVEVAHPNLQKKKEVGWGAEARARAKARAKCERAFNRDSRFVRGKGEGGRGIWEDVRVDGSPRVLTVCP